MLNSPILFAEEESNTKGEIGDRTETWTFYKLSTIKGHVTLRFNASSNGYYSEEVYLAEFLGFTEDYLENNKH